MKNYLILVTFANFNAIRFEGEIMLIKIQSYQDLYYALEIHKDLKEAKNPKFIKLRDVIREQIENLVE
ncbi:MAG: hypothetical protein ACFE95_07415 [Candidatus Hodarchaeota archaeon]